MKGLRDYQNWYPSSDQEWLLKAALLHGEQAFQAWQEWRQTYIPDQLDYGSQRLLPLLYRNLKTLGIDDPLLGQFKRAYLDTWAKNQVLFNRIAPLLHAMHDAGINTLVLKGASLILRYYRDFGVRPMNDFDILVPVRQVANAVAVLKQLGWQPQLKNPDRSLETYISVNYALHFSNPDGCDLDLHWHVLGECLGLHADDDFWAASVPIEIGGAKSLSLIPADDLFHICVHGVRWNKMPPVRWIADAKILLDSGMQVDWERLFEQTRQRRMVLPLQAALVYIADGFDAPIPIDFLEKLKCLPVSLEERKEYHARITRPGWSSYIPFLWAYYPRIARETGRPAGVLGFVKYLQSFWELNHTWQVPFYSAWRSIKRLFGLPSD